MDYFKHYSTASDSKSMNIIFDKFGHKGIAFWWMLVELCAENWDGFSNPEFTFHQRTVVTKLKSSSNSVRTWLELCSSIGLCAFAHSSTQFEIKIPKLLEIKESRGRIKGNKPEKIDIYRLDKEEEKERENITDLSRIDIPNQLAGINSPDELLQYWHENFLPKNYPAAPFTLGGPNQKTFFLINKRLIQNKSTWIDYLNRVNGSVFLTTKKRGGKPSLTWLLNESNFDDVWAGKYDKDGSNDQSVAFLNDLKLEA